MSTDVLDAKIEPEPVWCCAEPLRETREAHS